MNTVEHFEELNSMPARRRTTARPKPASSSKKRSTASSRPLITKRKSLPKPKRRK